MSKGKNFSRNRARVDRIEADFYQTPYCLTDEFVKAHIHDYKIEPKFHRWPDGCQIADFCCGKMAIQAVLEKRGFTKLYASDLIEGFNFFDFAGRGTFSYGIMNPPFRLFNDWVRHCFKVFSKEFALLAPTTYLQGVGRYNSQETGIFQNSDWYLSHIYTFNRYPMLSAELRPDGLIETGMQALSWFVFSRKFPHSWDTTIHKWLDIDKYVLRKGRRGKQKEADHDN